MIEPITRKWVNCKCKLKDYLQGAGCEVCNPNKHKVEEKKEPDEPEQQHPYIYGPWGI